MNQPETLKLNKEFKRAYYRGGYRADPLLVTYFVRTNLGKARYGITTGKKIGNAVQRNRSRRMIRAAFLQLCKEQGYADTRCGMDFVFVAREKTPFVKSTDVYRSMEAQIRYLTQQASRKKDSKKQSAENRAAQ